MSVVDFIKKNFFEAVYCVGYRKTKKSIWDEESSSFHMLKPSWKYWYADPIPVVINGKDYVFVEQYNRYTGIGHIGVSEYNKEGKLSKPQIIIREKTHLSFPMIICYQGNYYMIPESSQTETLEIYLMADTPYCWKHYYSIPIGIKIVDLCFRLQEDGSILLLGGVPRKDNEFYVARQMLRLNNLNRRDSLTWELSVCDNEFTLDYRPAGNFIERNGKIYRPTQESTERIYGLYLNLYEVQKLQLQRIEEVQVKQKSIKDIRVRLSPLLYKKVGMHTYGMNSAGLEVIDVSCVHPTVIPFLKKIRSAKKEEHV